MSGNALKSAPALETRGFPVWPSLILDDPGTERA
jgi:hypothetical protein